MRTAIITFQCIVLSICTFGCHHAAVNNTQKESVPLKSDTLVSTPVYLEPETTGINEGIYPVYELSPQTTAFVIPFFEDGQQKTFIDSIFDQVQSTDTIYDYELLAIAKNASYYDTAGPYVLIKSKAFETLARRNFNTEFYIYGTRGVAKTSVTDIVLGIDQCKTGICAFCIDKSTIQKIGHPLICTRKFIDVKIGEFTGGNEHFKRLDSVNRQESDYSDTIPTRMFGEADSLYFTYSDDFKWGQKEGKTDCKFPARSIFLVGKNGISKLYWSQSLDLFGIPCD